MPAFVATVVVVFVLKLVQWLSGYRDNVVDALWGGFAASKLKELGHERQKLYLEQQSVSAKDEYARWTKLNRRVGQLDARLSEMQTQLAAQRKRAHAQLSKLHTVFLTVPVLVAKFWKGKVPVVSIPAGMFPRVLEPVLGQGWAAAALMPAKYVVTTVLGTGPTVAGPVVAPGAAADTVNAATSATAPICLAIWMWALTRVVDTAEDVVRDLCNI
ncbi:LAMI_0D06480g1_1 [Lachancea mirantina]|uniref:LAMI_0D06480g1_1 n=1 Tax=Lachancea mirantina TaxID=1230905 RepID=A0A1G4JBT7_9SACH|nr:LAMI_0D06480g1_1 [Lachancea mirantina]